ncbi:MAG: hypothetical protein WAX85_03160 [Minisyncoccia bacterium]
MEANHNKNACEVCGSGYGRCGTCGHACGFGGGHILRWILGIIIISWVFSIGMKVGELKSELGGSSGYGYRNMMYRGQADWVGAGGPMMFTQTIPATVTTGAVKAK